MTFLPIQNPRAIGFKQLVHARHHKARQQRKFSRRAILSRFFRTVYAEIVATARKPCAAGVAHITSHGSDTDTESGASRAIHDIEGHGSFLVALDEAVCTTQLRLANISRRGNLDALFGPKPSTDCLAVIKRSILHFHGVPTDAAATWHARSAAELLSASTGCT